MKGKCGKAYFAVFSACRVKRAHMFRSTQKCPYRAKNLIKRVKKCEKPLFYKDTLRFLQHRVRVLPQEREYLAPNGQ